MRKVNVGDKYGRLTVLSTYREIRPSGNGFKYMAECECDCGKVQSFESGNLVRAESKKVCSDCGRYRDAGLGRHGHSMQAQEKGTLEGKCYRTWQAMKRRCHNMSDKRYLDYGGRGILICQPWIDDYSVFLNEMGLPPSMDHQIDRKDNNGDYNWWNCRWATRKVNARNKRNNHRIEINGKTKTLAEWSEISGVEYGTLKARIYRGVEPHLAIKKEKSGKYIYTTPSGDFRSLSAAAKSFKMSVSGANGRFESATYPEWNKHVRT